MVEKTGRVDVADADSANADLIVTGPLGVDGISESAVRAM